MALEYLQAYETYSNFQWKHEVKLLYKDDFNPTENGPAHIFQQASDEEDDCWNIYILLIWIVQNLTWCK